MLDDALIRKLGSIVGRENALTDDRTRAACSSDATRWRSDPDIVLRPRNTDEVAGVLKVAHENGIPVTPRGAGTGLCGGAVPVGGGISLSTERLNAAPALHKEDLYVEVAPGIINHDLQEIVESRGLFYPPDPSSWTRCTIGGNIAECAGGPRSLKYGTTRRYVLGLEIVTPEGEVLFTGARTVKSVAGYDVTRMMVGSEGTLCVITSAVLRLLPLPGARETVSAVFKDLRSAAAAATALAGGGLSPAALEVMDAVCSEAVSAYLGVGLDPGALLLAEFDGMPGQCAENADRAARLLEGEFGVAVRRAVEPGDADKVWRARRAVLPALAALRPSVLIGDVTVPGSKLSAMIEEIMRISSRHGVGAAVFGHAGSGNLHPALLIDDKDADEMARARAAMTELTQAGSSFDGEASAPRGIGLDRQPYFDMEIGQSGYEVMRSIKHYLDPGGIMNPGKMFYED
jgi:glycolate oxidase